MLGICLLMTTIFRLHSVRAQFFRFLLLAFCLSAHAAQAEDIQSPHRNLTRHFALVADGEPTYSLNYKGRPGIKTSRLGLDLKVGPGLASGFGAASSSTSTFDERWNPVWGGVKTIRNHYNQLTVTLIQAATKRTMLLHFRLFDDGLGLRYAFSKQPNDHPAVQPADPRADGLYARNFRNPDRRLQPKNKSFVHSALACQLALYVAMYSPLQMAPICRRPTRSIWMRSRSSKTWPSTGTIPGGWKRGRATTSRLRARPRGRAAGSWEHVRRAGAEVGYRSGLPRSWQESHCHGLCGSQGCAP